MRNQAQLKTAITSLRSNTGNAEQAKRPPCKFTFTLIIIALALSAGGALAKPDAGWNVTGSMSIGRFSLSATAPDFTKCASFPDNRYTRTGILNQAEDFCSANFFASQARNSKICERGK